MCILKCSSKARFKVKGLLPTIILIESTFFDVSECHKENLGGRIHILKRDRFLVPLNLPDKLFKNGFAQDWFLHLPIDFLDIVIFQFRVLGDKVSQNNWACDLCKADYSTQ